MHTSNIRVYKIPFRLIKDGSANLSVQNKFIVYILLGYDGQHEIVYVGKSVNGLKTRPLSHQDRCENWNYCFVLTQTRDGSFLNDGTIQYLENEISSQISADNYYINTTKQTNKETANESEKDDCREFLKTAYRYLQILGLEIDLNHDDKKLPIIKYDKKELLLHINFRNSKSSTIQTAFCKLVDGKYYLLKGTPIRDTTTSSYKSSLKNIREEIVKNGCILKEDMVFSSPSSAANFVKGNHVNGKAEWLTENGKTLKDWMEEYSKVS